MSSGKIILSVLGGVVAGILLGVIFAPDSGWNTRKRISKSGERYSEELEDKFNEILDTVSVKLDEIKDEFLGFSEPGNTGSTRVN